MSPAVPAPLWRFASPSPEATQALGENIGRILKGGEVILLEGDLGAGKTCFTSGLARGMGVVEPAVSPTFVILRSYDATGGLTLHHFDFYRFSGEDDLDTVGYEDCPGDEAVVMVEWPERCPSVFSDATLVVKLTVTGAETRHIEAWAGDRPLTTDLADFRP